MDKDKKENIISLGKVPGNSKDEMIGKNTKFETTVTIVDLSPENTINAFTEIKKKHGIEDISNITYEEPCITEITQCEVNFKGGKEFDALTDLFKSKAPDSK